MTNPIDTEGIISILISGGNRVSQNADAKIVTLLKFSCRAVDLWANDVTCCIVVPPNRRLAKRDLADVVNRSRSVELDNSTIETTPSHNIFVGSKNGC